MLTRQVRWLHMLPCCLCLYCVSVVVISQNTHHIQAFIRILMLSYLYTSILNIKVLLLFPARKRLCYDFFEVVNHSNIPSQTLPLLCSEKLSLILTDCWEPAKLSLMSSTMKAQSITRWTSWRASLKSPIFVQLIITVKISNAMLEYIRLDTLCPSMHNSSLQISLNFISST